MRAPFQLQRLGRDVRNVAGGFTLVELMVAMTGGLFLSIVVFALSRDASRFYQRESRIANQEPLPTPHRQELLAQAFPCGFSPKEALGLGTKAQNKKNAHACFHPRNGHGSPDPVSQDPQRNEQTQVGVQTSEITFQPLKKKRGEASWKTHSAC